ncbi:MAG: putative DNA binding domain-containing protein [Planctomycetes bacterium]|nr:putative DNA binding domain-containing protein [Planctomycetota bacterium]
MEEQIKAWCTAAESEHLEFKEASAGFDTGKLLRYCAALANEGGGQLVLGMTNVVPRTIQGTRAFLDLNQVKNHLLQQLRVRIDVDEIEVDSKRIVVFKVPTRAPGRPIDVDGRYYMRSGESLVEMTLDHIHAILNETAPDYSAEFVKGASPGDLDDALIARFRARWREKSGKTSLDRVSPNQVLDDAELTRNGEVTVAALVLLGTAKAASRFLAQSETVFEYRNDPASIEPQQRKEFRRGFFGYLDELWQLINLRNEQHQLRQGLFVHAVPDLDEDIVREALLNAFAHRDYRDGRSIWIRQSPHQLEITSPGGFPPGISADNVMFRQNPRNRRISEALQKCGLVERGNQGAKLMFQKSIVEGKQPPDYTGSDEHQVAVKLSGTVEPRFLTFLNRISQNQRRAFELKDLLVLRRLHQLQPIPPELRDSLQKLRDVGVVETKGRGKGTRYILARGLYEAMGERAAYTRSVGLDDDEKRTLVLKHLRACGDEGCAISEIAQVVPGIPRTSLKRMLTSLRSQGLIHQAGQGRAAKWVIKPPEST